MQVQLCELASEVDGLLGVFDALIDAGLPAADPSTDHVKVLVVRHNRAAALLVTHRFDGESHGPDPIGYVIPQEFDSLDARQALALLEASCRAVEVLVPKCAQTNEPENAAIFRLLEGLAVNAAQARHTLLAMLTDGPAASRKGP